MRKLTEKQTKALQDGFDIFTEKLRKGMKMKKTLKKEKIKC